ncbi:MAG: polysaccharide deacetylase family protein [Noviherbaspirillum sp.]
MQSTDHARWLCVSIHDVAPATWAQCAQLMAAVAAVADIPLTLLVVPAWHGAAQSVPAFDHELEVRMARGDELALHGYTHLDSGPPARNWLEQLARHVYTNGEGEFAALGANDAAERLRLGLHWFARRGWPLHGFVAPAWLLGAGGWQALRRLPLLYTTTWRRFYLLPEGQSLHAPSLVYSSRNGWGRALSRQAVALTGLMQRDAPLVRLSLHPRDAVDRATVRHFQKLLERLLQRRQAATKAAFAQSLHSAANDWLRPIAGIY